jgi:transcriptional regulator with PAS, ATPase and Fis domain
MINLQESVVQAIVVSCSESLRRELQQRAHGTRWNLDEAISGAEALDKLEAAECQMLVLDSYLPDLEVSEFRELVRAHYPQVEVSDVGSFKAAINGGVKEGAAQPESSGIPEAQSTPRFQPVRAQAQPAITDRERLPRIVGEAQCMRRVAQLCRLVARRDTTVLITGESGTGKDLVARAIHELSPRAEHPFVVVNCAAIPDSLLEAELFGHTKGAFTGAVQSRVGRIHAAQNGTLFLDEIGEMPLSLQSKLLRFLEQGEVQRLGSSDVFRVNVRVIAATNARLPKLIEEQKFREDLFYRISVFPIELPPLRDRLEDLPLLTSEFLTKFSARCLEISPDALQVLASHSWPGNVRELRNVMERASILLDDDDRLRADHILI